MFFYVSGKNWLAGMASGVMTLKSHEACKLTYLGM